MLETILNPSYKSQWIIIAANSVLLLVAVELGFRAGLRLFRTDDLARKGQIGGIQAAILGLLGLLLGFTFAMAVARYESRRDLVLEEANAIGTTYLRAGLLPESHQRNVESLLVKYVDTRIAFYDAGEDKARQKAAEEEATRICQRALKNRHERRIEQQPF